MKVDVSTGFTRPPAPGLSDAPGAPGTPATWGPGRKQAFGAAPGNASRVWFTLADGNLSEVFFPRLDLPVLHALKFLVAAPGSPPIDDALEAQHSVSWSKPGVPIFTVDSVHGEYRLRKEFILDPDSNALLVSGTFEPELPDLALYVQAVPHVVPGSPGNSAYVVDVEPPVLVARQGEVWVAAVGPFANASVGFVNSSDLYVDLHDGDGEMSSVFHRAEAGNVALGAQLGLSGGPFLVALGFAHSRIDAEDVARQLLRKGAGQTRRELERRWLDLSDIPREFDRVAGDGGALARASLTILRSLEDKTEPGAFIAAPAAPWGESQHDGRHIYHLVWPRDAFQIATALLDSGDSAAALRSLKYFERIQRPDGSWPQNCWIDGREHWRGLELDQVAYPILLAWRLGIAGLIDHDVYSAMVRRAAAFIVMHGPATPLDRWEDASGLSPATLAACIAALAAAEEFAYDAGDHMAAVHMRAVADYWSDRLEAWCFHARAGNYVRIARNPDVGPGPESMLSVDFLELVRRGIRPADNPLVLRSLERVDSVLRAQTPRGVAWRRYVGDRYGEHADGSPWDGDGQGRAWPLLTGERGHFELAAGAGAAEAIGSLESLAGPELVLAEQVWDAQPIPARGLEPGLPTNSVAPLGWAHAEYLKLLAAVAAGASADVVQPAYRRYAQGATSGPAFVWSHAHQIEGFLAGRSVKLQLPAQALVRWTADRWVTQNEVETQDTNLGVWIADLPTGIMRPGAAMEWTAEYADAWEGRNYTLVCRGS